MAEGATTSGIDDRLPPVTEPAPADHRTAELAPEIEGYHITGRLGQGGMGSVWRAVQLGTRREVALKLLSAAAFVSDRARSRFDREVELTARLEHPNIARVYDSGVHYSVYFYAMELVRWLGDQKAPTLTEYAKLMKLSARQRLELLAKVADAVHYAHQKGVIHRDLKPANVLVDESGQPKVLDFGVARLAASDNAITRQTDAGQLVGTLAYMSPEQTLADPNELDTRADVYALGVIGYELLSGRLPFAPERLAVLEAVRVIREEEPDRLGTIHRSLRGDVETIIAKALAKEKERRYASAAELAADIRRYLNDEPVIARPPSARYQLAKFARRNRVLVAGLLAVMACLVLGTVGTTWFAFKAVQRAREAELARLEAQRRSAQLRDVATRFLFKFDELIADVPGTTEARSELVDMAVTLLDDFAREAPDDVSVLADLSVAYAKLGGILGDPWQANLHQSQYALRAYRNGLAVTQMLLGRDPRNVKLWQNLAVLYSSIAKVEIALGNTKEAQAALKRKVSIAQEISAAHPNDPLLLDSLADHLADAGEVLMLMDHQEEALPLQEEAEQISKSLNDREPLNYGFRFTQARVEGSLGETQRYREDWSSAATNLRHAQKFFDLLAEQRPGDQRVQGNLCVILISLCEVLAHTRQYPEAIDAGRKSLKLAEDLAQGDSKNVRTQLLVSHALENLGIALTNGDHPKPAEASELFARALSICQRMMKSDPNDVRARRDLWYAYWCVAGGLVEESNVDGTPPDRRVALLRQARVHFVAARDVAAQARRLGLLTKRESTLVGRIPTNLHECADRLAKRGAPELGPLQDAGAAVPAGLRSFRFEYSAPGDEPGGRLWRQVDETHWVQWWEISGRREIYRRIDHIDADERHGTVLRSADDTREVFIPDSIDGGWVEIRATGHPDWAQLGQAHVETEP